MIVLGWHWETSVVGGTLAEIEENAQAEMRRFFGGEARDCVMEITPGEIVSHRDGGGRVNDYRIEYTARVRVSYTNYEGQE